MNILHNDHYTGITYDSVTGKQAFFVNGVDTSGRETNGGEVWTHKKSKGGGFLSSIIRLAVVAGILYAIGSHGAHTEQLSKSHTEMKSIASSPFLMSTLYHILAIVLIVVLLKPLLSLLTNTLLKRFSKRRKRTLKRNAMM